MKGVARTGDVRARASSATSYPDDAAPTASGAWSAGPAPLVEASAPRASSDGKHLVTRATCSFVFTGTLTSNGTAFTSPPSSVTLTAGTRSLRLGTHAPLVDGDEASDSFGNELSVSSTATWRTT